LRSLGYVRLDQMSARAADRKRNRALRATLQPLGRKVRQLRTLDEIWPVVVEAGTALGAVAVDLQIESLSASGSGTPVTLSQAPSDSANLLFRYTFIVPGS